MPDAKAEEGLELGSADAHKLNPADGRKLGPADGREDRTLPVLTGFEEETAVSDLEDALPDEKCLPVPNTASECAPT